MEREVQSIYEECNRIQAEILASSLSKETKDKLKGIVFEHYNAMVADRLQSMKNIEVVTAGRQSVK